jgi:hypothetical protein
MGRVAWLGVLLVGAIVPMAQAWAQNGPSLPGPLAPLPAEVAHPLPDDWYPRSGTGNALVLGGGVGNLRQDADDARTGVGGCWAVRLISGTRLPIAWEAAYVGSANDLNGPGVQEDDYLLRNGLEGVLRFNVPFVRPNTLLAPFAFAGAGWNRLDIVNAGAEVALGDPDNQFVLPFGGGLAVGYRGFFSDVRFTYSQAFEDEMFGDADMSQWNVGFQVGAEF